MGQNDVHKILQSIQTDKILNEHSVSECHVRRSDALTEVRQHYQSTKKLLVRLLTSIRAAAKKYNFCHISLTRFEKKKEGQAANGILKMGYRAWNKVFSDERENITTKYIIKAADIYYGFCPKGIIRIAYEIARKYNLNIPSPNQMDWRIGLAGT